MTGHNMDFLQNGLCGQTTRSADGRRRWRQDPEIFFPDAGASNKAAVAVCKLCPVKPECADYALRNVEVGIWGGMSAHKRKKLRREQRAAG